jgi:hypothetical protein
MDHLSDRRLVNVRRVLKNAAITSLHHRDPRAGTALVGTALHRTVHRRPAVAGIAETLAGEAARGVRATYTVVAESSHRRDPGYSLADPHVRATLDRIAAAGHEIAVHGSYLSLSRPDGLTSEFARLREVGHEPVGARQHWLRFRGAELFRGLEAAGARWDSTLGYPDQIGYRNGAAFPFLPYDLDHERPHRVMELPLVLMERALCGTAVPPDRWGAHAAAVLAAPGPDTWGGTAVLWHDYALTGTTMPPEVGAAYWDLLDAGDRWATAAQVAAAAWARWAAAGLPGGLS